MARFRPRHRLLLASFALCVLVPLAVAAWYLNARALERYASHVGFSVRAEETASPLELLGGLTGLSGASASDTDILVAYIQSQQMVRAVDAQLDLRALFVQPGDPVFALRPEARIEDLVRYWQRVVRVLHDPGSGLIEVRVTAFAPEHAHAIAQAIHAESTRLINDMSAIARADAMRYARDDLDASLDRLKSARAALTAFRSRTQIVDPAADLEGRMGLLSMLQEQLAEALIDYDLLAASTRANDVRMTHAQRRIDVIRARIADERAQFGTGASRAETDAYASLLAEFETLAVDLEFAQQSYLAARAAHDAARAEAQRQTRYLASYIAPTLAETAEYPRRAQALALVGGSLFLAWAVAALSWYALRDRR